MVQDSGDGVQGAVGVGVVVGSGVPAVTKEWVLGVEGGAQVVPRCRGGAGRSARAGEEMHGCKGAEAGRGGGGAEARRMQRKGCKGARSGGENVGGGRGGHGVQGCGGLEAGVWGRGCKERGVGGLQRVPGRSLGGFGGRGGTGGGVGEGGELHSGRGHAPGAVHSRGAEGPRGPGGPRYWDGDTRTGGNPARQRALWARRVSGGHEEHGGSVGCRRSRRSWGPHLGPMSSSPMNSVGSRWVPRWDTGSHTALPELMFRPRPELSTSPAHLSVCNEGQEDNLPSLPEQSPLANPLPLGPLLRTVSTEGLFIIILLCTVFQA